jgi:hypothetical protein
VRRLLRSRYRERLVLDRETPASDDRKEHRRERSTRLHCQANASVSVDHSDAPDHRPQRASGVWLARRSLTANAVASD